MRRMNAALLANTAWLDEELPMFRSLVVGLIDEQVRVVQVLPERIGEEEASAFGTRLGWRDTAIAPVRTWRLLRLRQTLGELDVTLLHALDGRLWAGTAGLARKMDRPAILNVNSVLDLPSIPRVLRKLDATNVAFSVATEPLANAVVEKLGAGVIVQTIPPGVHVPEKPAPLRKEGEIFCGVITGVGGYDEAYETLFAGLRQFLDRHDEAQFFLDVQGPETHRLWQSAGRFGLHNHLSLTPRRLGHRELLVRSHALMQPQSIGKPRGIVLQAMAHGVPVLAREDPWVDYLIREESAWVLTDPDPEGWARRLDRLFEPDDNVRQLVESARSYVRASHLAADEVSRLLTLYRQMTGETIRLFDAEASAAPP